MSDLPVVGSVESVPRTPEILNSLIAMSNPLEIYSLSNSGNRMFSHKNHFEHNTDSSRSMSSNSKNSPSSPVSIQHTCSQLIKAGLKLSIETKRKNSETRIELSSEVAENQLRAIDNETLTRSEFLDVDSLKKTRKLCKRRKSNRGNFYLHGEDFQSSCNDDSSSVSSPCQKVTNDDEEKRRRRRERNKLAATKCRLKKREQIVNLVRESEILETQNSDIKNQIKELKEQQERLLEVLRDHENSLCCLLVKQNRRRNFNIHGFSCFSNLSECGSATKHSTRQRSNVESAIFVSNINPNRL